MSVGKDPMIAITSPLQMSMFAMNLSRSPGASCNQSGYGPPMIAIMASDDCEQLHVSCVLGRMDTPNVAVLTPLLYGTSMPVGSGRPHHQ